MEVQRMRSFDADVELGGVTRRVTWSAQDGNTLLIENVSYQEAQAILKALRTSQPFSLPHEAPKPAPGSAADLPPKDEKTAKDVYAEGVATGVALGKAQAAGTRVPASRPATDAPTAPVIGTNGVETPESRAEREKAAADTGKDGGKKEDGKKKDRRMPIEEGKAEIPPPAAETKKPEPETKATDAAASGISKEEATARLTVAGTGVPPAVPDNIKRSKRMIEIMGWLIDSGVPKDVDKLAEACVSLKKEVPFLDRVADMKDRVQMTLPSFNEAGA